MKRRNCVVIATHDFVKMIFPATTRLLNPGGKPVANLKPALELSVCKAHYRSLALRWPWDGGSQVPHVPKSNPIIGRFFGRQVRQAQVSF